jgi:hypothetical protein
MDWIVETERLVSISEASLREDLPYISLVYIYIGKQKEVVSLVKDTLLFDDSSVVLQISKEKRTELVHTHKKENYTLKDTCLFHIPIEPEVISRLHEDSYKNYWTTYSEDKEIILPPSIFIFNPYNTLYFIYYEEDDDEKKKIKSSLKSSTSSTIGKLTKRVRWGGGGDRKRKTAHRK